MNLLFEHDVLGALLRIGVVLGLVFGVFVYLMVWAERKVSAAMQDRIGPNRLGPMGLLQGIADGVKFLFKENIKLNHVNPVFYLLAPALAVFPALFVLGAVPLGVKKIGEAFVPLVIANIDLGALFIFSVSSLSVFSILLAGWASNSKYPALGGLRAAAQMISYEIPMGLTLMAVVLLTGSFKFSDIVAAQTGQTWFFMVCPLGLIIFMVAMFAETNRLPFDLPEGESEIVGFHAEYAGLKFAMFFMAEYANMFTVSVACVFFFFGGWELLPFYSWQQLSETIGVPLLEHSFLWVLPSLWLLFKVAIFIFIFIWVRWTLPRFRYDQLMRLGWKKLIPLSLVNLAITLFLVVRMGA